MADLNLQNLITTLQQSTQALYAISTRIADAFPSVYTSSVTYNPPNLAAGASTSTTVTVSGAALGQVAVPSFSLSLQGMTMTSNVSAADTVTVVIYNNTAGAINLASGKLYVMVWRQ